MSKISTAIRIAFPEDIQFHEAWEPPFTRPGATRDLTVYTTGWWYWLAEGDRRYFDSYEDAAEAFAQEIEFDDDEAEQVLDGAAKKIWGQLSEANLCVGNVRPRSPTDAMLDAAREWSYAKYGKPIGHEAAIQLWQAMYDAEEGKAREYGPPDELMPLLEAAKTLLRRADSIQYTPEEIDEAWLKLRACVKDMTT